MKYPKIETVFNRDVMGTKELIPWDFRSSAVRDLANARYLWEATEKIDGTNIRVIWDGHDVTFKGRTDRAQIPAPLIEFLMKTFGTNEAEEMFEQTFGEKEVILFGEGYGPGIQKGGSYRKDVSFILFDVFVDNLWLRRGSCEDIARIFNIDIVPFINFMTIESAIHYVQTHPHSKIPGSTAFMEGLVLRSPTGLLDRRGNRLIVKIKWEDFKPEWKLPAFLS